MNQAEYKPALQWFIKYDLGKESKEQKVLGLCLTIPYSNLVNTKMDCYDNIFLILHIISYIELRKQ